MLRLGLRSVILVGLVLSIAGMQLIRPADALTVVFLVDGSDSVSPAQREQAVAFINQALAVRRPNDKAAVVVFGQNALVEWAPSALARLEQLNSVPVASRTNVADAIQLGTALFPADSQKRLVLLSDGRENEGRAMDAIQLAAARGVPLDVVPLTSESGPDVVVNALDAPDAAREGQNVTLQASINSSIATTGRLQIFVDGELVDTQQLDLEPGVTSRPINVPSGEAGFHRYEVRLEADGDTQPLNNRAAAFTTVQGPPRVLLVASEAERAAPLRSALEAASVRVEVLPPERLPAEQAQLQQYTAIMLVDVLARSVPRAAQQALPVYVREQGGSLAMIGGEESFGAGGWRRSAVAAALPVELDPKDTRQRPDLALVLVIDRSGSMSEGAGRNLTKLDLAKEAVYQSSLGLESTDQIGVVGFDTASSWVLPVQTLPNLADIEQALSSFNADGGTNIRSGIEPAAEALAGVDARVKHVILLTDGLAESNYADLIQQMQADGITISVVSIGTDANPALSEIAELGKGRFYRVTRLSEVPNIFLSETVIVAGRDIVEGAFTPVVALPSPIVRSLGNLPPLYGYNATEARSAARTILVSPDGKPILAQWQYGLGRAVAWTSDLKGQWARDWTTWSEFPRFIGGLLDALLPPQQAEGLALDGRTEGAQTILDLTARNNDGQPRDIARIEGRLLNPEDEGAALDFAQVGPGRYRAVVSTDEPGVYLAQVAVLDEDGQAMGNLTRGIVVSYSPEYRLERGAVGQDGVSPLLAELARDTGGRQSPAPASIFEPLAQPVGIVQEVSLPLLWLALLLWPLDIALRRLLLRWSDVAAARGRLGGVFRRAPHAAPIPVEATVARLQTARARVRQSTERVAPPRSAPTIGVEPAQTDTVAPRQAPAQPPAVERAGADVPPTSSSPAQPPKPAMPRQPSPPRPAHPDDALASLLAAKQRARRRKDGEKE